MNIGVLALQGDFACHVAHLNQQGVTATPVRYVADLMTCDGLVIPGGESTVMSKLIQANQLFEAIDAFADSHPVLGTCAGLILLATEVGDSRVRPFKKLPVKIERNAWGRQICSFTDEITLSFSPKPFLATFIRAPKIMTCTPDVQVLAHYRGEPVMVQYQHWLGASFHPELGNDARVIQYFLQQCKEKEAAIHKSV